MEGGVKSVQLADFGALSAKMEREMHRWLFHKE